MDSLIERPSVGSRAQHAVGVPRDAIFGVPVQVQTCSLPTGQGVGVRRL